MAKPTKPKDLKPKSAEDGENKEAGKGGGGGLDIKFIITIIAILLCSAIASVGTMYFVAPMVLVPAITAQLGKGGPAGGESGEGKEKAEESKRSKVGMNLELDEFTVNLKTDPSVGGSQFIRAKMALSISVPKEEECGTGEEKKASIETQTATDKIALAESPFVQDKKRISGTIVGAAAPAVDKTLIAEGGEGGSKDAACLQAFQTKMGKFVPSIRDIINSALMKRTAAELSSMEGQEALKDEIKEQINQLIGEEYKVIRVNFEDFIIQK